MVKAEVVSYPGTKSEFKYPCICRNVNEENIVILFTNPGDGIILKYQDSKVQDYQIGKSYRAFSMSNFVMIPTNECIELRNI